MLVTSSTSIRDKEKPAIDIDETKNSDTYKKHLQIHTKGIDYLRNERNNALEKIKNLEKSTFLMEF